MISGLCLRASRIVVLIFSIWLMPYQRCILREDEEKRRLDAMLLAVPLASLARYNTGANFALSLATEKGRCNA